MVVQVLSGEENMYIDAQNLFLLEEGRLPPKRRIYKWSEPTISIGYSQKECPFSVPVVRRPTGGGALLHGWDVSFSITDHRDAWGGSFSKIYKNIMELLRSAFEELGLKLELSKNRSRSDSYYCFDYPTLGELTYKDKKVVACAMRLLKNTFLVHGSVNTNLDYQTASQILQVPEERLRERLLSLDLLGIEEAQFLQALSKSL